MEYLSSLRIAQATRVNLIAMMSCIIAVLGTIIVAITFRSSPALSLLPIGFMFGWTQVASPCGMAVTGALTGVIADSGKRARWTVAMAVFTSAGLLSSLFVGVVLYATGTAISELSPSTKLFIFNSVALLFFLREARIISFPLPQRRRPSVGDWREFGLLDAAAMWGAHIGLGFSTFVNYGGPYVLAVAILFHFGPSSRESSALMLAGCYWLGRAASSWLAPFLTHDRHSVTMEVLRDIRATSSLQRWVHAVALGEVVLLGLKRLLSVG